MARKKTQPFGKPEIVGYVDPDGDLCLVQSRVTFLESGWHESGLCRCIWAKHHIDSPSESESVRWVVEGDAS